MKASEFTVVTFATVGKSLHHRDYTPLILTMENSCKLLGCNFLAFTFKDSLGVGLINKIDKRLPMRKGAGYWSWKAQVLLKALEQAESRYVLYLDTDLKIQELPHVPLIPRFNETGFAMFRTNERLEAWTSARCMQSFGLESRKSNWIFSASAILLDRENPRCIASINKWEAALKDDRLLIDPILSFRMKHRHDQSILSCLAAKKLIDYSIFPNKFYQTGVDNGNLLVEDAWLIHGNSEIQMTSSLTIRIRNLRSFLFHKIEIIIYQFQKKFKVKRIDK